jgi:hypothetical protein
MGIRRVAGFTWRTNECELIIVQECARLLWTNWNERSYHDVSTKRTIYLVIISARPCSTSISQYSFRSSPTSRRSWTHTQAQTHFVCCITHVVSETGNLPVCALSQMANDVYIYQNI